VIEVTAVCCYRCRKELKAGDGIIRFQKLTMWQGMVRNVWYHRRCVPPALFHRPWPAGTAFVLEVPSKEARSAEGGSPSLRLIPLN
jgi:hypothetical protein